MKLEIERDEENDREVIRWSHGEGDQMVGGYGATVEDAANDLCLTVGVADGESIVKDRQRHTSPEYSNLLRYPGKLEFDGRARPTDFHFVEWYPGDRQALIDLWEGTEREIGHKVIAVELGGVIEPCVISLKTVRKAAAV